MYSYDFAASVSEFRARQLCASGSPLVPDPTLSAGAADQEVTGRIPAA